MNNRSDLERNCLLTLLSREMWKDRTCLRDSIQFHSKIHHGRSKVRIDQIIRYKSSKELELKSKNSEIFSIINWLLQSKIIPR